MSNSRNDVPQTPQRPALGGNIKKYLRPAEAAEYLGFSISTLAKLRMLTNRKRGPRFSKAAGCIVYSRDDLDTWLRDNAVGSDLTRDPADICSAMMLKEKSATRSNKKGGLDHE